MTTFTELNLNPALLKALDGEGYASPTPIQTQAIPHVMAGRDLLGIAQTGTGKTAAFALPIMHRLAADKKAPLRKGCRVLVLSPTRELASQIAESFRTYGRHLGIRVAVVFGGVAHRPQIQAMAPGVDVLVATPGRLIDHMMERNVQLEGTEILVLDEADQMLDLGFVIPIRRIVQKLSARRQNLFFSATMPREIGKLADELLTNPARVAVTPTATTVDRVTQRVIHIEAGKKKNLLTELFADPAMSRTLVFTRTKRGADRVAGHLEKAGIRVASIHGNKSQRQREEALAQFKASKIRALIATDIAARGIDVDLVTHVVNFELPHVPESYVHRIGRTARAGAEGVAISLCASDERGLLKDIEKTTRQVIPSTDRRHDATLANDGPGGRSDSDGERTDGRRFGGDRGRQGARNGNSAGGGGYRARERGDDRGRERSAPRADRPASGANAWRPENQAAARVQERAFERAETRSPRAGLDPDRPAERPARSDRTTPAAGRTGRPASNDKRSSGGGGLGNVAFLARPSREGHRAASNNERRIGDRARAPKPGAGRRPF